MPKDLPTADSFREVGNLRSEFESVISPTESTRLRIWVGLLQGLPNAAILADTGRTRESLRRIRREIQLEGWTGVIAKLRGKLEARLKEKNKPKLPVGRPPTISPDSELTWEGFGKEPIIALASLVGGADVQFAVFAVRHHEGKQTGVGPILKTLRAACERPMRPDWSRGYVDHHICEPLNNLKSSFSQLQNLKPKPSARGLRIAPLAKRFPDGWKFLILHSPGCEKSRAFRSLVGGAEHPTIECKGTLTEHLEAVVYTLRVTQNLRGFVPSMKSFQSTVARYRENALCQVFQWHAEERDVLQAVEERVFDFYLRAAGGYMFDLTAHIRRSIPASGEFRAKRLSVSKIEIEPARYRDGLTGIVESFPDVSTEFRISKTLGTKLSASQIKKFLQSEAGFAVFDYVVRPTRNRRNNIVHYERFELRHSLGKSPVAPIKAISTERQHNNTNTKKRLPLPAAVMSVPRQFLMPSLEFPISRMREIAEDRQQHEGIWRDDVDGEPALLFHSPSLIAAIRAAFLNDKYGRRVHAIEKWEAGKASKCFGPSSYRIRHPQYPEPLRFGMFPNGEWRFDLFEAPFSLPRRTQSSRNTKDYATLVAKLPEPSLPLGRKAWKIVNYFGDIYGREDPFVRMLASNAMKLHRVREASKFAPKNWDGKTLVYLYKAFDADFLLRELADKDWAKLTQAADEWAHEVRLEVCETLFPKGPSHGLGKKSDSATDKLATMFTGVPLAMGKLLRYVPRALQARVRNERKSLPSWVFEALGKFERTDRVLRSAVETAQQFVLEGSEPKAMVIRKSSSILRSWRAYFIFFLRQKLEPKSFAGQPLSEHAAAPKPPFDESNVLDIRETFKKLAKGGSTTSLLYTFAELVHDGDPDDWSEALKRILGAKVPAPLIDWLERAGKAFRTQEWDSPDTLQAVAADLESARRSIRSPVKQR